MRRVLGTLMLALGLAPAARGQYFDPVEARPVASARQPPPGAPISVGVLFRIQRGWHVYWLNPGDAGLPTSVRWTAPDGFAVGPLQWPVPQRFEQPGGVAGYGYEGALLLAATLTAPASFTGGPVPLRADVGWLACEKICLRGKKSLDLTLGPDTAAAAVDPALFAQWAERLPAEAGVRDSPAAARVRGGIPHDGRVGTVKVTVRWNQAPAKVEWFPPDDPALDTKGARSRTDGAITRLVFRAKRLAGQEPDRATLESVVTWTDGAGVRHGLRVPIPLDGKEI